MNHLPDNDSKPLSPNANDLIHDFVVVSWQESHEFAHDDIDDESYDYCDDTSSMLSNGEHGHDLLSDTLGKAGDGIQLRDSMLTVPSEMMKYLDEAHAAAALARIVDLADCSTTGSSTLGSSQELKSVDDVYEQRCNNSPSSNPNATAKVEGDDCYSSAVMQGQEPSTAILAKNEEVASGATFASSARSNEYSMTSSSCRKGAEMEVQVEEKVPPEACPSSPPPVATTTTSQTSGNSSKVDGVCTSRASNKKRRKKLKLLMKAQAAANAAPKISERSRETVNEQPHQQTQKLRMGVAPSRGSSRKIANIAVVCAKETMSAHREELMRAKQTTAGA
jgi:hypothetical protein